MINKDVHTVGMFADRAFDEKDTDTLHRIAEDCLSSVESEEYTLIDTIKKLNDCLKTE